MVAATATKDSDTAVGTTDRERDEALASLAAVSRELDGGYRELQREVKQLRADLAVSRTARLHELAEKERLLSRLASLLAALPGGVVIVDPRDTIRDANPAALALLGEPLLGEAWPDVAARNPGLERGRRGRRYLAMGSRDLGEDGERVVLITDTTELHDLQEKLGRRQRLAALGEMAAQLAHQIRTPLASTTLYLAQLARDDLGTEDRARICERLSGRLRHMESLIESMLGFVRGRPPQLQLLPLRQVLDQAVIAVTPRLPETARLMVTPVDHTLWLEGDADALVGMLSNLVMNAVEIAEGAVRVEIWAGATSREMLQIRVRDNGPGIRDDAITKIFDPFFTTRAGGTGLGLAVVAMTAAHHGGEVQARNRDSGGAEFIIDLPARARPGERVGARRAATPDRMERS